MWVFIELVNSPEVECFYEDPPSRTKSLLCGIYSRFPLANHLAFPDSESIFGLSGDPPMFVLTSLSQDGFQWRGLNVDWCHLLWGGILPFLTSKELFCTCVAKKFSLTSRVRNIWSLYFIWAGLTLSYYLCLGVSIHRGQTNSSAWVLCISCLIYIVKILLHQVTNIFITLHGYHLCVSVYCVWWEYLRSTLLANIKFIIQCY